MRMFYDNVLCIAATCCNLPCGATPKHAYSFLFRPPICVVLVIRSIAVVRLCFLQLHGRAVVVVYCFHDWTYFVSIAALMEFERVDMENEISQTSTVRSILRRLRVIASRLISSRY